MKALEIEDDEVEGFLDDDDRALSSTNGYSSKYKAPKRPEGSEGGGSNSVTRVVGVVAAVLLIVLYLSGIGGPAADEDMPHASHYGGGDDDETAPAVVPQPEPAPPTTDGSVVPAEAPSPAVVPNPPSGVAADSPEATTGDATPADTPAEEPATGDATDAANGEAPAEETKEGGDATTGDKTDGDSTGDAAESPSDAGEPSGGDETPPEEPAAQPEPEPAPEPEAEPEPEPEPAPEPAAQTSTSEGGETERYKALKYSKMATVVPDPHHSPISDEKKAELAEKWGKWHFWDGDEDNRPSASYCGGHDNCDVPGEEFPDECWQVDAVYVNHLLDDADQLLSRSKEAIFTEYGHGKPLPPEGLTERMAMFRWEKIDLATETKPPEGFEKGGGWTTRRSFDGLVRRLLHAMMTVDTFTVVIAGDGGAAGHGNHFHQSYSMQVHKLVAPVLARLGVKLITRNMSQGGMGTLHNSLGFKDLYGDGIDLVIWDAGATEPHKEAFELFARQALLSGSKVPVIWGGHFDVLRDLHEKADADVGQFGTGMAGIPETESEDQAKSLPHATQFLNCKPEAAEVCKAKKFCTQCWLPRDDVSDPKALFPGLADKPLGQVGWQQGWRSHQLTGRVVAFSLLEAIQVAIEIWSDGTMAGPPLDEDEWHVTSYFENIRSKLKALEPSSCKAWGDQKIIPSRACTTSLKARSEHTPRFDPQRNSLVSLLKPAPDGYVARNEEKMMYEGPESLNECLAIPEGQIDSQAIIMGRRLLTLHDVLLPLPDRVSSPQSADFERHGSLRQRGLSDIVPGKGWEVVGEKPGQCDGSYLAICGREKSDPCPAAGSHDSRGAVVGCEFSGWLVMNLADVKEGIIILKMLTWLTEASNPRTSGWVSVDNAGRRRLGERLLDEDIYNTTLFQEKAREEGDAKNLPETFEFDYAIDGKVTTLKKQDFLDLRKQPEAFVELFTLLDDPGFTQEEKKVELAIRMRGCGHDCTFGVTHVYWA